MAEALKIKPDTQFVREVMGEGGADLNKCYQCATCSSVCELSPENAPFPRKQMILAQWGMKEKLLGDPAIWLCHNCGDCTTYCPRGAKPGDVFGALRNQAIQHFAFPRFLGRAVANPKLWPFVYLFCAAILAILAIAAPREEITGKLVFGNLFAPHVLEPFFFAVSGLVILVFLVGFARFMKALRASGADGGLVGGLIPAVVEIMAHTRFGKCKEEKVRHWGHFLTMWGFVWLATVSTIEGFMMMFGSLTTPLAMTNPLKILGNAGAVIILIGCIMLLAARYGNAEKKASSTYFDWFFIWTLTGIVATGILSEFLRLTQVGWLMFSIYFIHLILVFSLFLFAPYTKFAHLVYRTVAMAVARGRR